mmetsp:Transcript_8422/g.10650  ORF Transcript_8422/g.10650 Transcript_8422/m.10650 type:complete len:128 (-) Transcript_8422:1386-1769(-)
MEEIKTKYGNHADFITVYIAEAHAKDEWTLGDSFNAEFDQMWDVMLPTSMEERIKLANEWVKWANPTMPYYVDLMNDNARLAYGAWPERLAIVECGQVMYYGKQGPQGYDPDEVEDWLSNRFPKPQL